MHPALQVSIPPGSDLWSRSLLNREWTVRARCNDLAETPLVVTGRYGAGKVVVVATSAAGIGESDTSRRYWISVLRWLMKEGEGEKSGFVKPGLSTSFVGEEAHITLSNPASTPLPLQVVVRILSADGAILTDGAGELQRRVILAPRQTSTLKLALPAPTSNADEGIRVGRPLRVRIGFLSGDGAKLLMEQRMLTPPAALLLKVQTDNLYSLAYPFHAPGHDALAAFTGRMGAFVGAYAYAPGQSLHGIVTLSNGIMNLAPLSSLEDKTTPGNLSVMALNDEATGSRLAPGGDKIEAPYAWDNAHSGPPQSGSLELRVDGPCVLMVSQTAAV